MSLVGHTVPNRTIDAAIGKPRRVPESALGATLQDWLKRCADRPQAPCMAYRQRDVAMSAAEMQPDFPVSHIGRSIVAAQ
jgi:hypothetical protein